MKRLTAIILTLIFMLTAILPAHAGEIADVVHQQGTFDQNSTVQHGVGESYIAVIPADIALSATTTVQTTVALRDVYLARAKTVDVLISSKKYADGTWNVVSDDPNQTKISYSIKNGSVDSASIVNNAVILSYSGDVDSATGTKQTTLYFTVTGEIVQSGNYLDKLTFKMSIY